MNNESGDLSKATSWAEHILSELRVAMKKHPPMNSAHEGWAVIKEELDELWDEVKKRPSSRSLDRMQDEATQVAAMAIRFLCDIKK